MSFLLLIIMGIISIAIINMLIRYPLSHSIPTERGMHSNPIASSGGVAILLSYLFITIYAYITHDHNLTLASPIISLSIITFIGYIDDRYKLSKIFRFLSQLFISLMIVISSNDLTIFEIIIWTAFFLFFINIYNFMDGIDGLATSQSIFILLCISVLGNYYSISSLSLFIIPLVVFLFYNLSPSKIFLGNAGSYMLGMLISILIYNDVNYSSNIVSLNHIITIVIVLTVFIADSSYTLVSRFLYKYFDTKSISISLRHITTAHNVHNYQLMAKKYNDHNKVTLYLMLYNILWCFPLAYISQILSNFSLVFIIFSYMPYLIYCYNNNTGKD